MLFVKLCVCPPADAAVPVKVAAETAPATAAVLEALTPVNTVAVVAETDPITEVVPLAEALVTAFPEVQLKTPSVETVAPFKNELVPYVTPVTTVLVVVVTPVTAIVVPFAATPVTAVTASP